MTRASTEMATGVQEDVVAAAGGDPSRLYAIERDLSRVEARSTTLTLAQTRSTATQSALNSIQTFASEIGVDLAASAELKNIGAAERRAAGARSAFEGVVSALNARVGDRSIFAGADAAGPAVASADDILADVQARVAGATTAVDVVNIVEDYFFTDPAGYAASGYLGSINDAPEVDLGEGRRIDASLRADDQAVRTTLAALAMSVVAVENDASALNEGERLDVFERSSLLALEATERVIDARSRIGDAEARIEVGVVQNSAEGAFLEAARSAIVARDPFEAATEFTALETRLQSVFAVTARLSSLTLTSFLR
ncbi:MAG: flagellin [Pseudomonadota bacterium]